MSKRTDRSLRAIEDGQIELRRQDGTPMWIWASTCPDQECDCRSALIIAAQGDKEYLMRAARAAAMIRRARKGPGALEAELGEGCAAFELDIGTGEFRPLNSGVDSTGRLDDTRAGLERRYPWLGAVFESIDGETLEKIGRLWFRGKGRPDPESSPRSPGSVDGWRPGEVVSWVEAYYGVRQDFYIEGEGEYEAVELYCVMPNCACGEVVVRFDDLLIEDLESSDLFIGTATIQASGEWRLEPDAGPRELLERLWSRYLERHPNFKARHAERYPRMKAFGESLVAYHAARQNVSTKKPRPNEPCPCGSGKKYKKCCRLKTTG